MPRTPLNASSTPKDSKYKHHGGFIGGGESQRAAHKIQVEAVAKGEIIKYAKWPANGFFGGRGLVFVAVLRRLVNFGCSAQYPSSSNRKERTRDRELKRDYQSLKNS